MKKRLIKVGSSIALIIPKAILNLLNLKVNDEVNLSIKKNTIVIAKGE